MLRAKFIIFMKILRTFWVIGCKDRSLVVYVRIKTYGAGIQNDNKCSTSLCWAQLQRVEAIVVQAELCEKG